MKQRFYQITILITTSIVLTMSCKNEEHPATDTAKAVATQDSTRIVSVSGTTTEILCELGMAANIVGVDVTSTYPEAMQKLPKVGHNREISTEAIIALHPAIVTGIEENMKPEVREQLTAAHIRVLLFHIDYSVDGAKNIIRALADSMNMKAKGEELCATIDKDMAGISASPAKHPKVLFIYARGTGTMMVAGQKSSAGAMIELAGGTNAVQGFEGFKPLTPEAVVTANPDVILMFDQGLQSLGGIDGLLKVQGVAGTNAGKNKKVVEMEGQYLTGFGPRTGKAIKELSTKINEAAKP